ncbi:MAG: FAD-binding oxidoreductase [Armatimonadota bacterium]|nr:FAD-binding oxidoreductase [Armatimonadota bacterium]
MTSPDVVVIGGGCTGASAAFWLASRYRLRVVLLERRQIGAGPTGQSSGIVRMHYSYAPLIRLALRSLRVFEQFDEVVGGTADFRRTGFLILAPHAQRATLEANVRLQQQLGVATSLLTPQEVAALDPRLRVDDIGAGAYEPGSGYADGYATATGFAVAARRHGATVQEATPVERILVEAGRVAGVQTRQGRIGAGAVLVAAGPWTPSLLAPLGIHAPIRATRHQVVVAETPEGSAPLASVMVDLATSLYTRPDVSRQFLMGTIEESPEEEVAPDTYNEATDFAFVERMSARLAHRVPAFSSVAVRRGYASLYDVTPDWQPILGAVPEAPGLFVAAGFSGHGFKLSPAIGEALAGLIATGQSGDVDLSAFRLSRFAEGALIHSPYQYGIVG